MSIPWDAMSAILVEMDYRFLLQNSEFMVIFSLH